MPTCARCKKPISVFALPVATHISYVNRSDIQEFGLGNWLCFKCCEQINMKYTFAKNNPPPRPEIKCPFCGQMFSPVAKSPTTTHGNVARGVAFLPWGVVSAMKNKPFVQCPHCQMKIPQG
jgi:hypothetical protein